MCKLMWCPPGNNLPIEYLLTRLHELEEPHNDGNGIYFVGNHLLVKGVGLKIEDLLAAGPYRDGFLFHSRKAAAGHPINTVNCQPFFIQSVDVVFANASNFEDHDHMLRKLFPAESENDSEPLGWWLNSTQYQYYEPDFGDYIALVHNVPIIKGAGLRTRAYRGYAWTESKI